MKFATYDSLSVQLLCNWILVQCDNQDNSFIRIYVDFIRNVSA